MSIGHDFNDFVMLIFIKIVEKMLLSVSRRERNVLNKYVSNIIKNIMVLIIIVSFDEKNPLILIYGFSLFAYSSGPNSRMAPYKHMGWTISQK